MKNITCPHDKLWKSSMSDIRVAKEFFKNYLPPKIYQQLDLNSLKLCSTTYINAELKLTQSDVVYQAKIGEKNTYIYLLADQQSEPDYLMPLRLLEYNIGIWKHHRKQTQEKKLSLILNIVFYNGKKPYHHPLDMRALFDASEELIDTIWNKPFVLVDLQAFVETIQEGLSKPTGEKIMATIAQQFIEEGRQLGKQVGFRIGMQQGIKEGLNKGLRQGEYAVLMRLLKRKFTRIPKSYIVLLESADEEKLLQWAERLIDAETLQDIFID